MTVLRHFTHSVEQRFISDETITNDLVHLIACGKTEAVGFCIDAIRALKERVGSLSLQGNGPFGTQTDILFVYRFAEGDTSILRQKMARETLKAVAKGGILGLIGKLIHMPFQLAFDIDGLGKYRAALSWNTLKLAVSMMGKQGQQKLQVGNIFIRTHQSFVKFVIHMYTGMV